MQKTGKFRNSMKTRLQNFFFYFFSKTAPPAGCAGRGFYCRLRAFKRRGAGGMRKDLKTTEYQWKSAI